MKWQFSWREVAAGCLVLSLTLSGCALKQGDESIRHMTREDAQQKIVIGKTTKGKSSIRGTYLHRRRA